LYGAIGTGASPLIFDVRRGAAFDVDDRMLVGSLRRLPDEVGQWVHELPAGRPVPSPGPAMLLVRPEGLRLAEREPGAIAATVTGRRFVGPSALYTLVTDTGAAVEVLAPPRTVRAGQVIGILPSRRAGGGLHLFPPGEA